MRIRLILAIVKSAVSFALPSLAQQKDTVDPEVRQQIEAALKQYAEAYNRHDAAAIAALFTPDAVEMLGWEERRGGVSGQQAIEKRYAVDAAAAMDDHVIKLVKLYAIGSEVCAITKDSVAQWKHNAVRIYVRDANTWKINMAYVISTMAP